jgi:hypothetical protein
MAGNRLLLSHHMYMHNFIQKLGKLLLFDGLSFPLFENSEDKLNLLISRRLRFEICSRHVQEAFELIHVESFASADRPDDVVDAFVSILAMEVVHIKIMKIYEYMNVMDHKALLDG